MSDLVALKGVGEALAAKLNKHGFNTPQDLLFHLPRAYEDRTRIQRSDQLIHNAPAQIEGLIIQSKITYGKRRSLVCTLEDDAGYVTLRFFNFYGNQVKALAEGKRIRCYGVARRLGYDWSMVHPEYVFIEDDVALPVEQNLKAVYPTIEGITSKRFEQLIKQLLSGSLPTMMPEYLPEEVLKQHQWPTLSEALRFVHEPPVGTRIDALISFEHPMVSRLAFEELLAHRLSMRRLRQKAQAVQAPALIEKNIYAKELYEALPFDLTLAQKRVTEEIITDLKERKPMLRLLQGDVGSGKTLVAVLVALQAIASGYQAGIMVPTEILATQHYENIKTLLKPLGLNTCLLVSKQGAKEKRENLAKIQNHEAHVVVGTHALFQKDVEFAKLGLVIIDEQHRFGVNQRLALQLKGTEGAMKPHQLIMTATPIPRTLAMTAYADLDVSVIDELPPGRTPIKTVNISNKRREEVIDRVHRVCQAGRQAYWVCTLIEESESLTCQAAEDTAYALKEALPDLKVGLVHGRMKSDQKQAVMQAYKAGEVHLLVATTVIEVGVDVPNASLMIIENAERLGLSQLHQLRGRVGRGATESFCVLLYQAPLSQEGKTRLNVMRDHTSGFKVAEHDLKLRGPGEVLGTRQTGEMSFRIANLLRDQAMLSQVQTVADSLMQTHADRVDLIIQRWLGAREQFGQV